MNKKTLTAIRILAILAVILLIITTYCVGWLCASINTYIARKEQNVNVYVYGDNNDIDINSNNNSQYTPDTGLDNQYDQIIKALTATISFATAALTLTGVIIRIKNKESD